MMDVNRQRDGDGAVLRQHGLRPFYFISRPPLHELQPWDAPEAGRAATLVRPALPEIFEAEAEQRQHRGETGGGAADAERGEPVSSFASAWRSQGVFPRGAEPQHHAHRQHGQQQLLPQNITPSPAAPETSPARRPPVEQRGVEAGARPIDSAEPADSDACRP